MDLIRKKSNLTIMLILRELVIGAPPDQRTIASAIGITPQAVSDYMKTMHEEGLVEIMDKQPRATMKGVDLLQRDLLQLKEFIDGSINGLEIVRSTDAIARTRIRKGDQVDLFIEKGLLYCTVGGNGPSTGTADNDCEPGEIAMISSLSGMISVPPSKLLVIEVLPARKGGGKLRIDKGELTAIIEEHDMDPGSTVAVLDQEAAALMMRSGIEYDLEIPGPHTLKDTLLRGKSVVCLGTPHASSRMMNSQEIEAIDIKVQKTDLNVAG
jgi:putative transcriptional regulator